MYGTSIVGHLAAWDFVGAGMMGSGAGFGVNIADTGRSFAVWRGCGGDNPYRPASVQAGTAVLSSSLYCGSACSGYGVSTPEVPVAYTQTSSDYTIVASPVPLPGFPDAIPYTNLWIPFTLTTRATLTG